MNLHRIIASVYCEPWAITKAGFDTIHGTIHRYLKSGEMPTAAEGSETDFFGEPLPKMEMRGDLAVIPIKGPLFKHASLMERMCGACSYEDIHRDLDEAVNQIGVQGIWLDIDSPGGQCLGNQEVAQHITDLRAKGYEIRAYTDSQMCSAAYNIAAACDHIACARSSYVGCIGAMMALLDESESYKMQGLKVELFQSGPFKGVGTSGVALTEDQRGYLQGRVDTFAGMFKANVRANRGVLESAMQGQAVIGENAAEAGLIDEICKDLEDAIDRFG
jgi:signal peptide peptidase SppA